MLKYLLITRLVDKLSAIIRFHLSITYLYLRRAMSTVIAIVLSLEIDHVACPIDDSNCN